MGSKCTGRASVLGGRGVSVALGGVKEEIGDPPTLDVDVFGRDLQRADV